MKLFIPFYGEGGDAWGAEGDKVSSPVGRLKS